MRNYLCKSLFLILVLVQATQAFAANACVDVLAPKMKPNFEVGDDPEAAVFRALYYNRRRMTKESIINLNKEPHLVVDWGLGENGKTKFMLINNLNTKKVIRYTANDFPKGAVQIKEVRLADLLEYKNENIILRTMRDHPEIDRATAERAMRELMKWFFVKFRAEVEAPQNFRAFMYNETDTIDFAWHAFLLFSVDYRNFSNQYFGSFLEHTPGSQRWTPEQMRPHFYEYVRETLGEETYKTWYVKEDFNPYKTEPVERPASANDN